MSDIRSQRIAELFDAAVEIAADQRAAFLDDACAGDAEMRAEIESLLPYDHDADRFLNSPVLREPERNPERIGPYRILRRLGEGGMGTVYEAEQDKPLRMVALKVIRAELATPALLRRFEHEAQVLARLDHPGIAHVYAADFAEVESPHGNPRLPYFAMELVRGLPLDEYARQRKLGTERRIELIASVCDAIHHAHQKGVIHRDLKPANIIVNDRGEPKVLDFGVARITDADLQATIMRTHAGQLVGTLPYMSPEQVTGNARDLDVRSDVYSLGVVLYELLAGRLPYEFENRAIPEAVRIIQEDSPTRLSTVITQARGDLETIVGTALQKDRALRYQSADALAGDLRRYLEHQPIVARAPSFGYQVRLFTRRHRIAVAAALLVALTLVTATAVSVLFAVDAQREASERAYQQLVAERISSHLEYMLMGPDPTRLGEDTTVAEMLDHVIQRLDRGEEDLPEVEAEVRHTIGATYNYLGRTAHGKAQFARAAELWRGLDPLHARLPKCLSDLGRVTGQLGDPAGSEAAFREALAVLEARGEGDLQRRNNPMDHAPGVDVDASRIKGRLVTLLRMGRRFDEAEQFAMELIADHRLDPERDASAFVVNLRRLSWIRHDRGDFEGAEAALREAVELADRQLSASHPVVAGVHGNLGEILEKLGRTDESIAEFRITWELIRTGRPVGSMDWMFQITALAKALSAAGREPEAIELLESGLESVEAEHGDDDERAAKLRGKLDEIRSGSAAP